MVSKIPYSPSRLDSTNYLIEHIPSYVHSDEDIIDVGCGKLFFFDILREIKFKGKYLGLDITPNKLTNVPKGFEAKIRKTNIFNFKTEKKFDSAICLWVLEHIKKDKLAIEKIYELLKPEGILVIAVPSLWTWPFEFGRHGYHYYSKAHIIKILQKTGFKKVEEYSAGGLVGYVFMLIYSWPRYLVLVPALFTFYILKLFNLTKFSWKDFSSQLINKIFYSYHKFKIGLKIHNSIVSKIVTLDNKFKIFPASYVLILKK